MQTKNEIIITKFNKYLKNINQEINKTQPSNINDLVKNYINWLIGKQNVKSNKILNLKIQKIIFNQYQIGNKYLIIQFWTNNLNENLIQYNNGYKLQSEIRKLFIKYEKNINLLKNADPKYIFALNDKNKKPLNYQDLIKILNSNN